VEDRHKGPARHTSFAKSFSADSVARGSIPCNCSRNCHTLSGLCSAVIVALESMTIPRPSGSTLAALNDFFQVSGEVGVENRHLSGFLLAPSPARWIRRAGGAGTRHLRDVRLPQRAHRTRSRLLPPRARAPARRRSCWGFRFRDVDDVLRHEGILSLLISTDCTT
jgi:hypothetical protein